MWGFCSCLRAIIFFAILSVIAVICASGIFFLAFTANDLSKDFMSYLQRWNFFTHEAHFIGQASDAQQDVATVDFHSINDWVMECMGFKDFWELPTGLREIFIAPAVAGYLDNSIPPPPPPPT